MFNRTSITMKTLITTILLAGCALAENNTHYSFEDAAKKYDSKAEIALKNGNANDAAIYTKLAAIKRDAAKSSGSYDWSDYHALSAQLGAKPKKVQHKKKASYSFEDAAVKYDKLAEKATKSGNTEHAAIYTRMAAIKREAANSKGKYDWSEYHELEAKLK